MLAAGARELREELNTENFKPVAVFKNLFKYKSQNPRGYKGQKQSLLVAEFTGEDSDIKINSWEHRAWRWVEAEKLVESVHPVRRASAEIFMEKFNKTINLN